MIKFLKILHFLRYVSLIEFYEYFRQYLRPSKVQAAQILDLGIIFNEESDAQNILSKFQILNFFGIKSEIYQSSPMSIPVISIFSECNKAWNAKTDWTIWFFMYWITQPKFHGFSEV